MTKYAIFACAFMMVLNAQKPGIPFGNGDRPDEYHIDNVPFICQNPYEDANGWKIHNESCEEAAFLQAYYFAVRQSTNPTPDDLHNTIVDLIKWQKKNFGGHYDIDCDSVKAIGVRYFQLKPSEITVRYNVTLEDIELEVSQGNPVIVPTDSRTLKNPYYTPPTRPGPQYHMLTVVGYSRDKIFANDVGTKRGKGWGYDREIFWKSMQKAAAVMKKPAPEFVVIETH